jgi:hypothetical protein
MMMTVMPLLLALLIPAQIPTEPARDLSVHSVKAPGLEARFVDYHWQPELFAAMEKGAPDVPLARRNWVFARVILDTQSLTLEGVRLPVGNYAFVLWPNLDGKGMAVEVRRVDMRDVFPNLNAIGPAPEGEKLYKGPARFETVSPLADRLDVAVVEGKGTMVLTLRYGDRQLSLTLTR